MGIVVAELFGANRCADRGRIPATMMQGILFLRLDWYLDCLLDIFRLTEGLSPKKQWGPDGPCRVTYRDSVLEQFEQVHAPDPVLVAMADLGGPVTAYTLKAQKKNGARRPRFKR